MRKFGKVVGSNAAMLGGRQLTRRDLLRMAGVSAAGVALAGCGGGSTAPQGAQSGNGGSGGGDNTVRWLGWEAYNVPEITRRFEEETGARVSGQFFDGNSEAYNLLRAGGQADFDLVMADGLWPRLYYSQGLTQSIDYGQLPHMDGVFPDFHPDKYEYLREEDGDAHVAAPNCWGGYGFTVNTDRVDEADIDTLGLLFNEKYAGHLSTSARFEENIAMAGILAAHQMGTMDGERPGGGGFNPYDLTDEELERAQELLIQQKRLLVTRYNDENSLEQLFRSEQVWAAPEWSGVYRLIRFEELQGETDLSMTHVLNPREGGLGWVDTWCITSGVSEEKLQLIHQWIDFRLRPENMEIIATEAGASPVVDVRDRLDEAYVETLFMNQTSAIHDLYQFDVPSSPEKWEQVWSQVEAA